MASFLGSSSSNRAPIAHEEEEEDSAGLPPSSHLTAKPFYMPKFSNNIFPMKPLREPDAENIHTNSPHGAENDVNSRDPENIPGGDSDDGTDVVDGAVDGIDDGLLPEKPNVPSNTYPKAGSNPKFNGEFPSSLPEIPFGLGPRQDVPDVNVYQHKKTVAQGMMDIALLSANANQLRYVLESGGNHPYYYASLTLIGISLLLQVVVGVGLILNSRYNVSYETSMRKANRINNYTVLAIFLITVMNVFISAFGIASVNNTVATFPSSPRLISEGSETEVDMP